MDFITYRFSLLLKASGQAAILILLVLAAQWIFGRRLSPRWRFSLWLLVAVRLALPVTIPSSASLFNVLNLYNFSALWAGGQTAAGVPLPAPAQPATAAPSSPLHAASLWKFTPSRHGSSLLVWSLRIWSAGVLALGISLLVTHRRLSRTIGRQRPLIDPDVMNLLEDCKQRMGVRVPVTLIETAEVGSPTLFGFVRPRLLLPTGFTRDFSLEELYYVFLHELGHIKRRDILIGWLMTALQILHWFNPLVWFASQRMRVDRELACDALALAYAHDEENQRYGQTIIKLLESFGRPAWTPGLAGIGENKNQIKERIRMIAKFRKTNRGPLLALALFAGLGLITLTDAQSGAPVPSNELAGTWVLVGSPNEEGTAPAAGARFKLITDKSFSVTQADPQTGVTMFHHGGSYSLKGDEYSETIEYANDSTSNIISKTFKFTVEVKGDTLTQKGIGNPWNEVWKRAKKTEPLKPRKGGMAELQGTWQGQETGDNDKGATAIIIQGSTLEFREADTNNWVKATFSTYDTKPKQLIGVISDCSYPQIVGLMACAIYDVKDGSLTLSGFNPGKPVVPGSFDAQGSRKIIFKRQ